MKNYDVIVVGAGTAGTYFAKRMAEAGFSVLVIDKCAEPDLGKRLEIFHIDAELFERFGVPRPVPGDEDYVTLFEYGITRSPFDNKAYEKRTEYPFLVMQFPLFLKRLVKWARGFNVEYSFDTAFFDYIYDGKRICGVKVIQNGETVEYGCRLVADCSGMASAARRKLPESYGVETFEISPRDMFYVVLRYVTLKNPEADRIVTSIGYPSYKSWMAPQLNPDGAIFGVGANLSYDYAEKCYAEFEKNVKLPPHTVDRIERGATPYRRPPYSFVADGFVTLGDSACLTKPFSGEGITSAWVLCDVAARNIIPAMKNGMYPTREGMWNVNVEYTRTQGADFAELMTSLIGAVDCTLEEMEYEFKHSIVFKESIMERMNREFRNRMTFSETLGVVFKGLGGLLTGNIRGKTIKDLLTTLMDAGAIKKLYRSFPDNPADFPAWEEKADALWTKIGTMADKCRI